MSENKKIRRPKFRNINIAQIITYRLPLAGVVSILHRISGLMMFLFLPSILLLLEKSLVSKDSFEYFQSFSSGWVSKWTILILSWGYLHHFCSGIRHLVMDNHIGLSKVSARNSAVGVLTTSLLLTFVIALKLFGVL
jgi:succinate dehydrogenase / fumarate reductase cytochrome b subunit